MAPSIRREKSVRAISKCPTGIRGLDELTGGGLPKGRPTLVCGSAGSGKTLFGLEFLFRGATEFGDPGVFMAFEESKEKLAANAASLGFDLPSLCARKKIVVDYVHVDRSEIEETGEYDLGGLFARLAHHVRSVGAKRVVFDTLEVLFSGLRDEGILRSEVRRLFRWIEDQGLTAVVTAERGGGELTRHGLEEYVSDCVILLDHRVSDELSTRRLRIVKYRGSAHGTNEVPFLIDEHGLSMVPISTVGLDHDASKERVSTGVGALDDMLSVRGLYRGSTVLVSGTAGTGKSSLAASFARASTERGERVIYFSLEESANQILRNMRSIGIDLEPAVRRNLLRIEAWRPSMYGLEMHLVNLQKHIEAFAPRSIIVDPVTSLVTAGSRAETRSMLVRLIDLLKVNGITAMLTSLTPDNIPAETSDVGISSLIDTWLSLGDTRGGGERNRTLQIIKSRGMSHSNQIREFVLNDRGIELVDVYLGDAGLLTGSARLAQESRDRLAQAERVLDEERHELTRKVEEKTLVDQIDTLKAKLRVLEKDRKRLHLLGRQREEMAAQERYRMAVSRKAIRPGSSGGVEIGGNGRGSVNGR